MPAIVLEGVTAGYVANRPIVKDLNLTVPWGACWAILGPSGGGKTTLLRVIAGLLRPQRGTLVAPVLTGTDGVGPGALGYIPQNLGLVRNASVRENVLLGSLKRLPWWRTLIGRFPAREIHIAEEALARVGLPGRGSDGIETLSGGERRRVAIARALMNRPALLLADEFLAEVDWVTEREIVDVLQAVRRETGMTMLFVDHDVDIACRIAERIVIVSNGRKVCELAPRDMDKDRIHELYRPGGGT